MNLEPYIEIPTWTEGQWTTTVFNDREEYKEFVKSLFKEPGQYAFDETIEKFNEQARRFAIDGLYTKDPLNSRDYLHYWGKQEKDKCRKGVIFNNNGKTWYLTRDYYFWINFLKIYDKAKKGFFFPEIWDTHYHIALYEHLAELHYTHVALLKKRQIGSSYFHLAKIINQFWFEEGATLKIGASLKDYINEKGDWKFLNEYRKVLNRNTGWYRGCDPDKTLTWQQRAKGTVDGKEIYIGNDSTITGYSFENDPTSGVGGSTTIFYHEEAGIAPKMDTTYEFIRPALSSGMITTGLFIAAGSVGDLAKCQPLKQMMLYPEAHGIYPVDTNLLDEKGTLGKSGLFIPEQWSMPPYIDKYGNSLVEESLKAIAEERLVWKKELSASLYQLRISQKPINIHEAFAYRNESVFPMHLVSKQIKRIEDKEYPIEHVKLERDDKGKVEIKRTNDLPIIDFPIKRGMENKEGVVCIHERPPEGRIDWGTYYASVDPVDSGKTSTSDSLFSIYIYKATTEVTKIGLDKKIENRLEGDKIVAWWCGRFDDINKTHDRAEMLIDLYNAWTIVEANKSNFITHMINQKKQHMLVPRSQLLVFNKDMKGQSETYQEYGWKNSVPVWNHLLGYGIEYLKEVLDTVYKQDTQIVVKNTYGIERIPDIMLLREMMAYEDGKGNYDRIVAYCALVTFAKIQQANLGFHRKVEKEEKNLESSDNFRNFLYGTGPTGPKKANPYSKGSPFKHYR